MQEFSRNYASNIYIILTDTEEKLTILRDQERRPFSEQRRLRYSDSEMIKIIPHLKINFEKLILLMSKNPLNGTNIYEYKITHWRTNKFKIYKKR